MWNIDLILIFFLLSSPTYHFFMCGFFFLASFLLFLFRSLSPVLLLLLLLLHDIIDVVVVVNCAAYANSESLHLMCHCVCYSPWIIRIILEITFGWLRRHWWWCRRQWCVVDAHSTQVEIYKRSRLKRARVETFNASNYDEKLLFGFCSSHHITHEFCLFVTFNHYITFYTKSMKLCLELSVSTQYMHCCRDVEPERQPVLWDQNEQIYAVCFAVQQFTHQN